MDRLIYTDQKTSSRKSLIIEYAKIVITGIVMGIGSFMVLKSQFGLKAGGGIGSGGFTGGMIRSWNQIAETLAGKDGVFLDQLEGASNSSGLFLSITAGFFIVLSILIARSGNKWFAILYPLLFLPVAIGFDLVPSVLSMAVLALGVILFLAACPGRKDSSGKWRWSRMAYALAATGLALVIICVPAVSKLADKPDAVQKYDDKISGNVVEKYYGVSPLGEGDLTIGKRKTGKGTALTVTMSEPQSIYLRGFVGDVLDGCQWETLPYSSYYDNRDLVYWVDNAGLNGLGQVGQAARLVQFGQFYESDVDIEVGKASKKYAYIPYEITEDGVYEDNAKNWNDSFVTSTRGSRLKEYSYTMGENAVKQWTNVAGALFTSDNDPQVSRYLEAESFYNTYVYENYLYITDEDMAALERVVGDKGDQSRGHLEYNTAIDKVKGTLAAYISYDEYPGKPSGKKSAVRNLFNGGVGYDVHYASVATLMFRYYGIPARYVEGYLITPQDVYTNPDGTFEVKQSAAHAWTEIYVDGIGFVPVETCPKYAGIMEEADYTVGISNKSVDNNFSDNQAQGLPPEDTFDEKDKGVGSTASRVLMIVGLVIALAILALLVFLLVRFLRKKLRLRRRKKLFKEGEPREAVRDMYRYMDEIGLPASEMTTEIGNRASYSTHQVMGYDQKVMLAVVNGAKAQLRRNKRKKKDADKRSAYIAKFDKKQKKRGFKIREKK